MADVTGATGAAVADEVEDVVEVLSDELEPEASGPDEPSVERNSGTTEESSPVQGRILRKIG